MKINWKVRLKNPYFYAALFLAVVAPVGTYFGVNANEVTSWTMVYELAKKAVLNPYIVVTVIISVATFLIDPTTKGLSDSKEALKYEAPRKDEK